MMPTPPLILASASPRRVDLLRQAGYAFDVDPADIDEDDVPADLAPAAVAQYLAVAKATHVSRRHPGAVVLGADTVVAIGDRRFGKAETPDAARAMLRTLGGCRQQVITGVALVRDGATLTAEGVVSEVDMRAMTDAELEAYVAGGEWRGKAGAYGLQDHDPDADPFVKLVGGTFSNVVGLPIERVGELLTLQGIDARKAGA